MDLSGTMFVSDALLALVTPQAAVQMGIEPGS